jgi:hypothetical protein
MKTSKYETMFMISQVTNNFVRKMNIFKDAKEKRCKGYIKKIFRWHLNISIMMLYFHN